MASDDACDSICLDPHHVMQSVRCSDCIFSDEKNMEMLHLHLPYLYICMHIDMI